MFATTVSESFLEKMSPEPSTFPYTQYALHYRHAESAGGAQFYRIFEISRVSFQFPRPFGESSTHRGARAERSRLVQYSAVRKQRGRAIQTVANKGGAQECIRACARARGCVCAVRRVRTPNSCDRENFPSRRLGTFFGNPAPFLSLPWFTFRGGSWACGMFCVGALSVSPRCFGDVINSLESAVWFSSFKF